MTIQLVPLPPADAIKVLEARGRKLSPSFAWQDIWQETHGQMFTVAKSAGFDILNDIWAAVEGALKEGKTPRQFAKELTPVLQAKGWWGRQTVVDPATGETVSAQLGSPRRLQTIFDVNMRVSYAAGHWASFERNKKARPWLRYVAVLDDDTRPAHRARHNLCLPVDHPYWDTWAPPCGWNCRCTLQSLSDRDIRRLQTEGEELFFEPPKDVMRSYINARTGVVSEVPDGIDPGWAYNPGKAGWRAASAGADKLIPAPPDLAAAVHDDQDWILRLLADEFAPWFDTAAEGGKVERTMVTVGALSRDVLAALKARGIVPMSGAITIDQRAVRHMSRDFKTARGRAVAPAMLRRIPDLLANPKAILRDKRDGALLYVFDVEDDRVGKLVVRLDYATKARPQGGTPVTITTNMVRTAGLVEARNLRDPQHYDVISGEI